MVFIGAALPVEYGHLEVSPLGPAGRAAERADLGCGAPGATWGSTAGRDLLVHVTYHPRRGRGRSWSPGSNSATTASN